MTPLTPAGQLPRHPALTPHPRLDSSSISPEMATLLMFNALGHSIRWKTIILLMAWGEQCVTDLVEKLELDQPKVSHHLAVLVGAELIYGRRNGRFIFYRLSDLWNVKENAIELLVGGKVGISIGSQAWVSTD